MIKRLISFFLTLVFLVAVPLSAAYRYNPYTRKLDYYEAAGDIVLGDIGDITLTGLATGNILYYDGAAWVNLATGANTEFLTLAAGIPAWAAVPAGVTTFLGLTDTPAAYAGKAGQLVRVNAGANALEFFAGSPLGTVIIADGAGGWTKTENYRVSAAGIVTLGTWQATAVANAYVAGINQNLLTTSTPTFDDLTISTPVNIYALSHNSFADYAANRHVVLPNTLANVLSDHNLAAHTVLGLFDQSSDVDHDATTNYLAAQHLTLPAGIAAVLTDHDKAAHDALLIDADTVDGEHAAAIVTNARVKAHFPDTIVNVLSDHNLLAHTALGLFDSSGDVDHDLTTNYDANKHIDHTAVSIGVSGLISGGGTIASDRTITLTEVTIEAAIDTLANLTSIQAQTVTFSGSLNVEANSNINQDVTSDGSPTFDDLTISTPVNIYGLSHNSFADYAVNQHVVLPGTIANVLSDHALLVHTTLGLFDASSDVDHNATTNYFIYNHVGEDHVTDHNLWVGYLAGEDITAGQGQYNTLIGEEAGKEVTTGDDNVIIGYQAGYKIETGSYNVYVGKEVAYERTDGNENVIIGWQAGYGAATSTFNNVTIVGTWAGYSLNLGDENNLFGAYAASELTDGADNCVFGNEAMYYNETGNHNVVIGNQAGMGVTGQSYSSNVFIGNQVAKNVTTGSSNVVIGYMAGEGWLDTENEKLVIDVTDTTTPLIYGDFSADNITINGDFNVTMDAVLDQIVISQSDTTGTDQQPLIFIDDDRTGTYANEPSEATLRIDGDGVYSLVVADGYTELNDNLLARGQAWFYSLMNLEPNMAFYMGGQSGTIWKPTVNGAADTIFWWGTGLLVAADETKAIFFNDLEPNGDTAHDNYLSPTLVIGNDEGADANDYSAVVIGERTQANVKIAHYFDFYAMTGAVDGSVDASNAELAAIFRFGASGSAVPGSATTPGDVLFESAIEVDGISYFDSTVDISTTDLNGIVFGSLGTATIGIDLSASGLTGATDYLAYFDASTYWGADGVLRSVEMRSDVFRSSGARNNLWLYNQDNRAEVILKTTSNSAVLIGNTEITERSAAWSSTAASADITKAAHGFGIAVGDLIHIYDSSTAADEDFYRITAVPDGNTITLDRTLTGTEIDVAIHIFKDVIAFFASDGVNGQRIMNYSHQDKPLQIGGDELYATSGLGSEDVLFGGFIGLVNGEEFQHGDYVVSATVNWDDASPVAVCTVADGYAITDVWCEVTTVADGDLVWTVGDGVTADGFLTDAGITQGVAAYYGQVHSARGTYLFNAGEEVDKIYTGADTVDCFITESTASQGVIVVYVHITRLK